MQCQSCGARVTISDKEALAYYRKTWKYLCTQCREQDKSNTWEKGLRPTDETQASNKEN